MINVDAKLTCGNFCCTKQASSLSCHFIKSFFIFKIRGKPLPCIPEFSVAQKKTIITIFSVSAEYPLQEIPSLSTHGTVPLSEYLHLDAQGFSQRHHQSGRQ